MSEIDDVCYIYLTARHEHMQYTLDIVPVYTIPFSPIIMIDCHSL